MHLRIFFSVVTLGLATLGSAAPLMNAALQNYFEGEVARIEAASFKGIQSRADWERERPRLKRELSEMLGLDPLPARGDLRAVVTGTVERDGIIVEKVHFQSSPGLYVTGNFYRPAKVEKPLPTILYVCGHGQTKTNGVSYGNKVAYQHHGAWFARNGYTCLTIDTIQLGEIEGKHHGTAREGMWWWNSRGYTPAGVEAWNCMRALDYLETRAEVDKAKFGVTGRSGGGAYSWWIAALDERIKVAAPVAGITDLRDHVGDGVVEGHCDCMYFVNTYQWDYPLVAALVAPRPLLIGNSDKDAIFPLDGVVRTHSTVAKIYGLLGAERNLGLLITEGPHKDTQDLQVPVFRWFNRHLKGQPDTLIEMAATKLFTGQELKVFDELPAAEITTTVHDTFVPPAAREATRPVKDAVELRTVFRANVEKLRTAFPEKVFRGWPHDKVPFNEEVREIAVEWKEAHFDSQPHVRLKLFYKSRLNREGSNSLQIVTSEPSRNDLEAHDAILVVRSGTEAKSKDRNAIQVRRRYNLVGQTLDGMRVWDITRGVAYLQSLGWNVEKLKLTGDHPESAVLAKLMLGLNGITVEVPNEKSKEDRPDYLNLLRFTTWDELNALASPFDY